MLNKSNFVLFIGNLLLFDNLALFLVSFVFSLALNYFVWP